MDITIGCEISLSKKLRALIDNAETNITIITSQIKDGKGEAKIILSLERISNAAVAELMDKETSIMFTPNSIQQETPAGFDGVTNIYSSNVTDKDLERDSSPVSQIAATKPPEKGKSKYAIKSKEIIEKETPKEFTITKNPEVKKFIVDFSQLMDSVRASENKAYNVDIDSIQDPRKKAVAIEEKEKAESIDYPAYVVNDKCATLTINDLGISLMLNSPYNLANISAKRLAASQDLKSMFRSKMIKFISPDEIQEYMEKAEQAVQKPGLDIFSSHSAAEKATTRFMEVSEDEMDLSDLDRPTEQERLASVISTRVSEPSTDGVRKSQHGFALPRYKKEISTEPTVNKDGIKQIRKKGIEYR